MTESMNSIRGGPFQPRGVRKLCAISYCLVSGRTFRNFSATHRLTESIEMSYNKYDEVKSSKPPIVVMHGLFGSKSNYHSLSKAMNKRTERTIYAVDARNHGNSAHTDEFSYELLAEDIKDFVNNLSLGVVSLIGHSMGGRAAMMCSLSYPQLVEKLIVVDISPFSPSSDLISMQQFFNVMRTVQLDPSLSTPEARQVAAVHLSRSIKSTVVVNFLLTNLVKTSDGGFKWRMNIDSLEKNFNLGIMSFPHVTTTFEKPTLFIAGLRSSFVPKKHEKKITQVFPNSQFVYLDTGHWVHSEKPEEYVAAIAQFLKM